MKSSNIKKYLSKYAEPESQRLDLKKFKQNQFENILVIPAYGESSYPVLAESSSLTVLVINEPDFSNNKNFKQLKQVNQNLIKKLKLQNPKNILAINKTGLHALPQKQGVGQARKIGCDIALKLISEKIIKSPFIHTTDADVKLPTDYFDRANNLNSKEIGALVYNFKHNLEELDSNHRAAMLAYENYLHSYVACLKECASPYAFHTVGSTLAFQAEAYAQVRGMPKKSAGEDFYILNKIAKVSPVLELDGEPLILSSRLSNRTPFGTGQALNSLIVGQRDYRKYTNTAYKFKTLKNWLRKLDHIAQTGVLDLSGLDKNIQTSLESLKAPEQIQKICQNHKTYKNRRKNLNIWFDALKTLRFVNLLS